MTVVAVDTGGTFTDLVASTVQGLIRIKVPSTPHLPEEAILNALRALANEHSIHPSQLIHGTTVGTNALLEKKGARVVLITNEGFEDILYLRRQNRPNLYALYPEVPPPLVSNDFTVGVPCRMGPQGEELQPLPELAAWLNQHRSVLQEAEVFTVSLLHSYANSSHEEALRDFLKNIFPKVPITLSSEIVPLSREYERTQTAVANSFITPKIRDYLERLKEKSPCEELYIMGSAGGCLTLDKTAEAPILTALSGPAGGLLGARAVGNRAGKSRLLSFDMGGTSTDIAVVDGEIRPDDEGTVGSVNLRTPLLKIETIGAGGGSIAYIDNGGALRVGPESAGATPGPACYGNGGNSPLPTVTDANVVLNRIQSLLGGSFPLDKSAAHSAIASLANELDSNVEETAKAIIGIANASMARASKRASMSQGVDPRALTLVAFGGAGGLHACEVADEIGCCDVLFPAESGLLSAEGMLDAPLQSHHISSLFLEESAWEESLDAAINAVTAEAQSKLRVELPVQRDSQIATELYFDIRYLGQTFALSLSLSEMGTSNGVAKKTGSVSPVILRSVFEQKHRDRFGYDLGTDNPLVLVSIKSFSSIESSHRPKLSAPDDGSGDTWKGPQSIPAYSATLWLPQGWQGKAIPGGDILCSRTKEPRAINSAPSSASLSLGLEIHRQRLASIAEEMGAALMQASFSANIKERRDFSCALFDNEGSMLAHAAHIPVHLGSQPLSVAAVRQSLSLKAGETAILNDPFAGGTHLPDVTLVSPVFLSQKESSPVVYASNRAHHADVGGISPGSLPAPIDKNGTPRTLSINDEGVRIPPTLLTDSTRTSFANSSRTPRERLGDLRAQEAANAIGIRRIRELYSASSTEVLSTLNNALLDYAEKRMRSLLRELPDGEFSFCDSLETGNPNSPLVSIPVTIRIEGDSAVVDFSEAPPALPNSLNAVKAITVAAVFYVFQCLGEKTVPANSGMLRPITILTEPGTICDATFPSAVSAGNVETSQRLVDILFGALAKARPEIIPAASGGSMNNVLFGGTRKDGSAFVHYETLACGAGAGPFGPGADAIQTHMTNTLNTPVEQLEREFPVLIKRYCLRRSEEKPTPRIHRGGFGICREYEFLEPVEVTVLSERREKAPYGANGGPAGQCGENWVRRLNAPLTKLPAKVSLSLKKNEGLMIKTPGGGYYQCREENELIHTKG